MLRAEAIFRKIFGFPMEKHQYSLTFRSVPDIGLSLDSLAARIAKEESSLTTFVANTKSLTSMTATGTWLYTQHMAYASRRLLTPREPPTFSVLKSY